MKIDDDDGNVGIDEQSYQRMASMRGGRASFRSGLQQRTGQDGKGMHAHHVFPHRYTDKFAEIGIDNNNPQNGAWWEASEHLKNSYAYNLWWDAFFGIPGVTASDAKLLAQFLSYLFGFEWTP